MACVGGRETDDWIVLLSSKERRRIVLMLFHFFSFPLSLPVILRSLTIKIFPNHFICSDRFEYWSDSSHITRHTALVKEYFYLLIELILINHHHFPFALHFGLTRLNESRTNQRDDKRRTKEKCISKRISAPPIKSNLMKGLDSTTVYLSFSYQMEAAPWNDCVNDHS